MAHQEAGWPLGLQLLNLRVGLGGGRARDYFGSCSFNTALTSSSSSSMDSSSDLDSESIGSLFHERSILDISRHSMRRTTMALDEPLKPKKRGKPKTWFFSSLCSKDSTHVKSPKNPPSVGQFIVVERRCSKNTGNLYGRTRNPYGYLVSDEMSLAQHLASVPSSLFLNGEIAPIRLCSSSRSAEVFERDYIH